MSQTVNPDRAEIAQPELPKEALDTVNGASSEEASVDSRTIAGVGIVSGGDSLDDAPTEEELHSLRRVSGHINWAAYSVAVCELAERFSYYGSSVLYTNFIVHPLPKGSNTGAGFNHGGQSGALGMGSRAGQGISLTNQFFAYMVPLFG